jgi:hypothetical protein
MRTATDRAGAGAGVLAALAAALLSTACVGWPVADPAPPTPATAAAAPAAGAAAAPAPAASVPASIPAPAPVPSAPPRASAASDAAAAVVDAPSLETAARAFYTYFDRVRQMPPAELAREFVRLDQPSNPAAVLELALALGQTRNPNDTLRALATLDPLVKSTDPQVAPWRPLARLLALRYTEQRRLEEQVERQSQQLRDAQRRQEQLAQQLEALKAIERSLVNRPPAAPSPPAGANGTRAPAP